MGLAFVGGEERFEVALTDPRLEHGLHPQEGRSGVNWRWTKGDLTLVRELYSDMSSEIELHVRYDDQGVRAWLPPAAIEDPACKAVGRLAS